MKVYMLEWFGGTKNLPAWFTSGETINLIPEQIIDLHQISGLNIMLKHHFIDKKTGIEMSLLAVSNSGFGQR